ncbi:energy-coupling factor transporter transmembrane protein EcfT [Jeotgalibaca sp. MA1X17-3]|uniref:energy-coupling factor transporter transmembrane component T n=1 Tax=Jeotgalibaca sp. MA1X17-3 TaxID=2908211 RepID=UPI001F21C5E3|nr:energy-coupling factor transporter transmembrane component T [Jeotgalibaca sp. MA1X17-3]UJF15705.1 energy-coupling factor transporter transmembrane protein EcfT [Jeotgalibaca sp. MA1X17-3]
MELYEKLFRGFWRLVRGIRSTHPFVLLIYFVGTVTGIMLYQHPIFLMISFLLIILFNMMLDKGRELKKWTTLMITMGLFTFVLTPLFNQRGNHILFYLFNKQIMLEAIIQGAMIALTLVGILALFVTFNILFTTDKFLFVFSKFSQQWTLLIMLAMRFVPLLRRKINDMQDMQSVKGLSIKEGNIRQRAKNGMQLLQMLLSGSLEDSIQAADSMTARGYGTGRRSHYHAFQMQRRDYLALLFLLTSGVMLFYGWRTQIGVLELLPQLEPFWQGGFQNILMVIWVLFIGFPIVMEGREVIKWKLYQLEESASLTQKKSNVH